MLNVAVLCSKRAPALDALLGRADVNVVTVLSPVPPPLRDRREHDAKLAEDLARLDVDLVVCLGYLYILTDPMLAAFGGRILNLHDGERRFPGLHATRDAILAGARETRSIVHIVDETLDGGPILFASKPYPVAPFVHEAVRAGETKIVNAYAYAHREWMIRDAWPSLLHRSVDSVWRRQSCRRVLAHERPPARLPAPHEAAS